MRILSLKTKGRQQAGMTLLEAMVAMAIFGVSFFSLYAGMSLGFSIIGSARENLRATQVMVEKMETIRLYSWDQINTPGFIPAYFTESYYPDGATSSDGTLLVGGTSQGLGGLVYNGKVTIGSGPEGRTYSGDMRTVTINLTWTSGGRTHTRRMSTFVAHYGLQKYIY